MHDWHGNGPIWERCTWKLSLSSVLGLDLVEELGQCCLASIFFLFGRRFLFSLRCFIGNFQQLLEELHTVDLSGFEAILQRVQTSQTSQMRLKTSIGEM